MLSTGGCRVGQEPSQSIEFFDARKVDCNASSASARLADIDHGA
jgi:hypothetical protein